ncbi:MAG TPA: BMP family ABC transporter substrate-binding protein [Actinomycetota bacterium]|nr:BMP family ABC transporter substrate-binding protein [Actinomycetota bacterium]
MPRWLRTIILPISVLAIVSAACSDDTTTAGAGGGTGGTACPEDFTVGVALDVGGLGDNGFNDLAKAGLDQAIAEGVVCQENTKFLEANSEGTNLDENVLSLAEEGFDAIVGTGFAFTEDGGVNAIAPDYPDTSFGIIDGYATCGLEFCPFLTNDAPDIPNVADLTFTEEQGSYLVGVAAALKAQELGCDTVGFLGGQTGFLIGKFEAGYRAGVAEIDPNITVLVEYLGDTTKAFDDITGGEAKSNAMYDDGACIIYHAAGDSGNGLFAAAAQQQKLAIGVDSDQYNVVTEEQRPFIMTSMIKRVDTATFDFISSVADGSFEGGAPLVYDLAGEGIGFATSNPEEMGDDIVAQVQEYADQIIAGDIVPPTDPTKV